MTRNRELPDDPIYDYEACDPFRDAKFRTVLFVVTELRALVRFLSPAPIAAALAFTRRVQRISSFDWQPVEATAESVVVEERNLFHAEISYSYNWENERYGGRFRRVFGSEFKAELYRRKFRHHERFAIRVNPRSPDSSLVV